MAAPITDEEIEGSISSDFYAVLNTRKEASAEELKQAYRRLCMLYHPDKHQDEQDKVDADAIFNKIQKAYTVLSDPDKRAIYDVYGEEGLEAGMELVARTRTPEEIREEYERQQKEREERRLQQITNPRGGITVGVDATDFFDYGDEYEDEFSGTPSISVKSMAIEQSIDVPMTGSDTVSLSGHLVAQNGNGMGNFALSCRRVLSHQSWGEFQATAGNGPAFAVKYFKNIGKRSFVTCSALGQISPRGGIAPGLVSTAARQLDRHTMGYLTWRWGLQSAMTTMIVRDTIKSHAVCSLQFGIPNTYASASYTRKFEDEDTRLTVAIKAGVFGSNIEYGGERKISKHSRIGARMSIGVPQGIMLKIKFNRANQNYVFPIHLSQDIMPNAIFYGTVAPLAIFWIMKAAVIDPYLKKEKERDIEKKKEESREAMKKRKKEADNEVRLMQEMVRKVTELEEGRKGLVILEAWYGKLVRLMQEMVRKVTELEEGRKGLVILEAWYGKLVSIESGDILTEEDLDILDTVVIDVVAPLQCQVKDSKLMLTDVSKSSLPGFYDPCVGEDKSLRVRYEFRQHLHECTVEDTQPLRIPKQSHRIDT